VLRLGTAGVGVDLQLPLTAVAEYDAGFVVQHNVLLGGSANYGVTVNGTGAGAFRGGGGLVRHNTVLGFATGIRHFTTPTSSRYPMRIVRNLVLGATVGIQGALASNQLGQVEDFNVVAVSAAQRADTVAGAGTAAAGTLSAPVEVGAGPLQRRQPRPLGEPASGAAFGAFSAVQLVARCGGTGADAGGGGAAWTNPANVDLSNDVLAVSAAIAVTSGLTNALRAVGFGLPVPVGATVVGVRADVEALASASSSVDVARCQLVLAGAPIGTPKSATTKFTTGSTFQAFGSGADLWGAALSQADVTDAGFGVELVFRNVNAATRTCSVDAIRLVVYYTHPASESAEDLYGRPRPGPYGLPCAAGAVERGDVGVRDGLTYRAASPSLRIDGFGTHDWQIPTGAEPREVLCYLRKSPTYTGPQPRLQLLADAEIGVAFVESLMVGPAEAWEAVALAFTPTKAGVATVRVFSPCTAPTGAVWVDDFRLA
jgi:hypothetical protein